MRIIETLGALNSVFGFLVDVALNTREIPITYHVMSSNYYSMPLQVSIKTHKQCKETVNPINFTNINNNVAFLYKPPCMAFLNKSLLTNGKVAPFLKKKNIIDSNVLNKKEIMYHNAFMFMCS